MSTTLESNGFLQELNPLYDLTPANYLTAVVTELGLIPPSSVPTVLARAGWQEL
jgi:translation initiation factor eIF-2B subunit delta